MIQIPLKAKERLIAGIKKFLPILVKAHDKDINESDTVTIISDMLTEIFGYDKYTEITSEYAVKKTYCDLAIKIEGKPLLLIEVKSIGLDLKDDFVRQAVDYGSNAGIEWIILTNAIKWKVYKVIFAKPIEKEFVYEVDFRQISSKKQNDLELLYYLCKEAITKSSVKNSLDEYHTQKQLLSRFLIGQILMTDQVIDCVRKTVKKMAPDARVSNEEILCVIAEEIIKREVFEGEKAIEAKKRIMKLYKPVKATPAIVVAEEAKAKDVN
jgi:hypothetical protein